jgi:DNA-binding NtrC family response regulator
VITQLMEHDFPGNVRELENIIQHAFVLCHSELIELRHLPPELRPAAPPGSANGALSIRVMERNLIEAALRRNHGHRARTARDLGINPSTLYRKMKSLEVGPKGGGRTESLSPEASEIGR